MEFPKRLLAVQDAEGKERSVAETLIGLPVHLLPDGVEVAVYGLLRVKKLEISRRLVDLDEKNACIADRQTV